MPKPGLYSHTKTGAKYRVLFTARNSTNGPNEGTVDVVYIDMKYGSIYTREESQFMELIDPPPERGFNPGVKVPRFQFYSDGHAMTDADAESLYDGLSELASRKPAP